MSSLCGWVQSAGRASELVNKPCQICSWAQAEAWSGLGWVGRREGRYPRNVVAVLARDSSFTAFLPSPFETQVQIPRKFSSPDRTSRLEDHQRRILSRTPARRCASLMIASDRFPSTSQAEGGRQTRKQVSQAVSVLRLVEMRSNPTWRLTTRRGTRKRTNFDRPAGRACTRTVLSHTTQRRQCVFDSSLCHISRKGCPISWWWWSVLKEQVRRDRREDVFTWRGSCRRAP